MLKYILLYVLIINLTGFFLMGIDKRKAIKHAFRIPEATLFLIALHAFKFLRRICIGQFPLMHAGNHKQIILMCPEDTLCSPIARKRQELRKIRL